MMDVKRGIFSLRFLVIVAGFTVILFLGTWDELQRFTQWGISPGGKGLIDILSGILLIDKFKIVLALLLGGLFTDSFSRDEKHHYLREILARTDLLWYCISRVSCNIITVLAGSFAGFAVYSLLVWGMGVPVCSTGMTATYYAAAGTMPVLYLAMIALQFGAVTAACSNVALLFSAYQPDAFVSLGLCGMVFFIAVSFLPLATPFDVYNIIAMMPVFPGRGGPAWANWLWGLLLPASVSGLCGVLFYRRMKWRKANGYI